MASDVSLRFAAEAEAAAICALHIRTIREVCAKDYTAEQVEAWTGPKRPEHYVRPIREKRLVVAEVDGQLAGFSDYHANQNEICAVYVSADFQRRGVGRALFRQLVEDLKARGYADAWFDASLSSVAFYEAMGCVKGATQTHQFRPGVEIPCVRMTVKL